MEWIDLLSSSVFWVAVLRTATPLILGTLGVLLCERAGVLNLGIEGIMVAGAFTGWFSVYCGAPLWVGVCAAGAAGILFGFLHGILTVLLGVSQHVSGLGITMLSASLTYFCYRMIFANVSTPPTIVPFDKLTFMQGIPVIGAIFSELTVMTLLALFAVGLIWWILNFTPLGLSIKMVGENPSAVEGQGLSVIKLRIGAVMAGSALMGIAGGFLTLAAFNAFFFNMINGRGWICIALVVFASWRPGKALLGAIIFAFFDVLQLRLQQGGIYLPGLSALPYQLYLMLPYLLSILALVIMARKAQYPQALMKPYRKGER